MSELVLQKRLLLISSSTIHGHGYLDHVEKEVRDFLGSARRLVFLPYALYDRQAYAVRARERFQGMGCTLTSAHDVLPSCMGKRYWLNAASHWISLHKI